MRCVCALMSARPHYSMKQLILHQIYMNSMTIATTNANHSLYFSLNVYVHEVSSTRHRLPTPCLIFSIAFFHLMLWFKTVDSRLSSIPCDSVACASIVQMPRCPPYYTRTITTATTICVDICNYESRLLNQLWVVIDRLLITLLSVASASCSTIGCFVCSVLGLHLRCSSNLCCVALFFIYCGIH